MNLLQVENLTCGYGCKEVIKDVSFSVKEGDFTGIIGPNGAGKTTLFRAITGALALKNGSVSYDGVNIKDIAFKKFASQVAVIPQLIEIPFAFTIEEFVFLGRFPHLGRFQPAGGIDRDAVDKAIKLADVSGLRDRKMSELSGGERQRAFLAQGFAQEPRVLFLDEPTAHLDIAHQVQIMDILRRLNKETGLTVVIILHDLNLASEYCRQLVMLDNGKIFKKGGPDEVLTYKNIEEVYKTVVLVEKNPITLKPYLLLISQDNLKGLPDRQRKS